DPRCVARRLRRLAPPRPLRGGAEQGAERSSRTVRKPRCSSTVTPPAAGSEEDEEAGQRTPARARIDRAKSGLTAAPLHLTLVPQVVGLDRCTDHRRARARVSGGVVRDEHEGVVLVVLEPFDAHGVCIRGDVAAAHVVPVQALDALGGELRLAETAVAVAIPIAVAVAIPIAVAVAIDIVIAIAIDIAVAVAV